MGYTTDFFGEFDITPVLKKEHNEYLRKFADTRRMKRDLKITEGRPDPTREAVGLPIGVEGEFFVGAEGFLGQEYDDGKTGIIDSGSPPSTQPGLWCKWEPSEDGSVLRWNEAEKFYDYIEWLVYLTENFFKRWGYVLNGEVDWKGESHDDTGIIVVKNNNVYATEGEPEVTIRKTPLFNDELSQIIRTRLTKRN